LPISESIKSKSENRAGIKQNYDAVDMH